MPVTSETTEDTGVMGDPQLDLAALSAWAGDALGDASEPISATRIGAYALGFGTELGTIEPGKQAALIAVALPSDLDDVETFLVQGIGPSQVRWVDGVEG